MMITIIKKKKPNLIHLSKLIMRDINKFNEFKLFLDTYYEK